MGFKELCQEKMETVSDDILEEFFCFMLLDTKNNLVAIMKVCKRWNRVANRTTVWQRMCSHYSVGVIKDGRINWNAQT